MGFDQIGCKRKGACPGQRTQNPEWQDFPGTPIQDTRGANRLITKSSAPEARKTLIATIMPTRCGIMLIAVENPSLAPSTKDSYTGTFLVNAYNGTNAIITGMAQTEIQLMKVNKGAHPFMPGLPLFCMRGGLCNALFRYQRSAIMAASVAIMVAISVVPTISVAFAE